MYITTTGTIVAQLTRLGRQTLADNSANFKITQYQFSDDEINYADFDGSSVDASNATVLSTPILEANSFGGIPTQRFSLFTKPNNTLQISRLDTNIGNPFVDGTQDERPERNSAMLILNSDVWNTSNPFKFTIRTLYGYDSYYLVSDDAQFLEAGGPGGVVITHQMGGVFNRRNVKTRIVIPFTQKPDTFPCSDPYETLQNQSQAEIQIHIDISPEDYVYTNVNLGQLMMFVQNFDLVQDLTLRNAVIKGGAKLTEQEIVNAWFAYYQQRSMQGIRETIGAIRAGQRPGLGSLNQYVDQYKETGLAISNITIRGADTGQLFTVSCFVYSGALLSNVLMNAFDEQGR